MTDADRGTSHLTVSAVVAIIGPKCLVESGKFTWSNALP